MTLAAWVLAFAVVFAGALVQGSVGIGLNLLAGPILIGLDPRFVPVPTLMIALALTLSTFVRERHELRPRDVSWAIAGRVPGTLLAIFVLGVMTSDGIAIALALLVLFGVTVSALGARVDLTRRNLFTAGAVAGLMGTTTGVGGPPVALLYQRRDGPEVRANLALFFVVGSSFSLVVLGLAGRVGMAELRLAAPLWIAALAGFATSTLVVKRMDTRALRPALLVLAGLSATVLLVRTLTG